MCFPARHCLTCNNCVWIGYKPELSTAVMSENRTNLYWGFLGRFQKCAYSWKSAWLPGLPEKEQVTFVSHPCLIVHMLFITSMFCFFLWVCHLLSIQCFESHKTETFWSLGFPINFILSASLSFETLQMGGLCINVNVSKLFKPVLLT